MKMMILSFPLGWSSMFNTRGTSKDFVIAIKRHCKLWGKAMMLAVRVSFSFLAPTRHLIEAMHKISYRTVLVNALFWSTQWST